MDAHIRSAAVTLEEVVFRDRDNSEIPRTTEAVPGIADRKKS